MDPDHSPPDAAAPITLRPATANDLEAVVDLLLLQMRDHHIPIGREPLRDNVVRLTADPAHGRLLLALHGDAVVGVAYLSFAEPMEHAGQVAWLEELFVMPAHRGQGIGERLVKEAAALAESLGCVSLDLEVDADHVGAARLYQRLGFRSLRRTHQTLPLSRWDWG